MSAHGADERPARALRRQPGAAGARTGSRAARSLAGTVIALIPLVLIVYYLLQQGPGLVEPELLHDRPDRQHVLQELEHRRHQERDPRHDRDRRAGLGDRGADRRRRRGVARRVRHAAAGSRTLVRFFVDVLTGVPSIVFGLFVYIVLVVGTGTPTPATRARSRCRC